MLIRVLKPEEVEELYRKTHKKEIEEIERKAHERAYNYIIYELIDACDSYIESNYKYENIYERFGKSLEDFKNDIFEKWKDRERSYEDPFIEDYEEEDYEDDNEDW